MKPEKLHPSSVFVAVGVNMSNENGEHVKAEPFHNAIVDALPGDTHASLCQRAAKLLLSMHKDMKERATQ